MERMYGEGGQSQGHEYSIRPGTASTASQSGDFGSRPNVKFYVALQKGILRKLIPATDHRFQHCDPCDLKKTKRRKSRRKNSSYRRSIERF
ncbi:hypothetical protein R1sor_002826 [Riccia sorocarpa]|uniref:Uncharacterized protein n=1 Tax=Riccia sorocarpa TaxID=122646 RepID=A0ABD3H3T4_9MARC